MQKIRLIKPKLIFYEDFHDLIWRFHALVQKSFHRSKAEMLCTCLFQFAIFDLQPFIFDVAKKLCILQVR